MLTDKKISVLVSSLNQGFSGFLEPELKSDQAFQLSATDAVSLGLLAEIEQVQADVVVLLHNDDAVPGIVSQIFDEYPGLIVIVFNQDNDQAVVCKQSITRERVHSESLVELLQRIGSSEKCEYWGESK